MGDLIEMVASWHTLLMVVAVFGFIPGFVLRLLVRIYPRDDPRRRELVAELYELPRIERPLWVAEQLETVLFEGLPHRAASLRINHALRRKAKRDRRFDQLRQQMGGRGDQLPENACPWAQQLQALELAITGLTKRRSHVLVVGSPGSGKTALAHLTMRELLTSRAGGQVMPVWIDARRWNPATTSFRDLAAREIARRTDATRSTARELVATHGRVVPILDGLDEMGREPAWIALRVLEREWSDRPMLITARPYVEPLASASTEVISFPDS